MDTLSLFPYFSFPLLLSIALTADGRCPKPCTCSLKMGRKTVFCSSGGLSVIPTADMDLNTHVIVFTAPEDNPNNVTIGRIFLKFTNLEVVRITHSNVPAIGDSSFWPGRRLKILDLQHNSIRFLRESDFNGLKNLQVLDLSDNQISATPSAPFRYLSSLTNLSLARNRLETLVPRFFYLLSQLQMLDLSGNSLQELDPENLQDVNGLKVLKLSNCRLTRLHSLLYQQLPNLQELDLSNNLISVLAPEEFRHLTSLTSLHLDGNTLSMILEDTFRGHSLQNLTLSRNNLSTFVSCSFCNSSVNLLDLSQNKIEIFNDQTFQPFSDSLQVLNVSYNSLTSSSFASMMKPLRLLRVLDASNIHIDELLAHTFSNNPDLIYVNLSHNRIPELVSKVLDPLIRVQILDVSHNALPLVNESVLEKWSNVSTLTQLRLHSNPYSCSDCDIEPLTLWLNSSDFFNDSCDDFGCLRCYLPDDMAGRLLHSVTREDFSHCFLQASSYRSLMYTSQAGLIVAVAVIVVLIVIIIAIIIVYRRHVAHYYTHEENRPGTKGLYDNPVMASKNGSYSDEKPSFVSIQERVDDNITDFGHSSNSVR